MRGAATAGLAAGLTGLLAPAGCAQGPGHGFGEIEAVSLEAGFAPGPARDLGDGWALTDLGYRYRLERLEVGAAELTLEALAGADEVTFDPAHPPEGYTLCHSGHCHAEDGSLVSYEEVEAELAGGEAAWTAVAAFGVDRALDLVAGDALAWDASEPACLLGAGELGRVSLPLDAVRLEATVWDDDAGTTAWTLALEAADAGAWTGALEVPLDRDHDPVLTLAFAAAADGLLLDGIDPDARTPGGGALALDDAASAAVAERLADTEIATDVTREPF